MPTQSRTSKSCIVIIIVLFLIVLLIYGIDLFEFNMDVWQIHEHISPVHLVSNPLLNLLLNNQTNTILLPQITIQHHANTTSTTTTANITHQHEHESMSNHSATRHLSQLFSNPHGIINGNPFHFDECKNALLHKHNIDIQQFTLSHTQHLSERLQHQIQSHLHDIVWSRELLDALNHSVGYTHIVRVRLSYDANNPQRKQSRARDKNEPLAPYSKTHRANNHIDTQQLLYYHISKCGSSSIHNMLSTHYNTTRMYWRDLLDVDSYRALPDIECAFSFVRHPIDRVVSGYYTILSMLQRDFQSKAQEQGVAVSAVREAYERKYPWFAVQDIKARFRAFVHTFLELGYRYIADDHLLLHVATQIGGSIGNFHAWPIHFLGRMEYFEEHWYALTMEHERCAAAFDSARKGGATHDYTLAHSMRQMGHHEIDSADINATKEEKERMKQKGVSAEHLVFVEDKQLFQKTVDYYYQSFVCFGYNMTHDAYLKHLEDKYYI